MVFREIASLFYMEQQIIPIGPCVLNVEVLFEQVQEARFIAEF